MPQFERTPNGRYLVFLGGAWIGTVAPYGGGRWWFVPRMGAGHTVFEHPKDVMSALEKEYSHGKTTH